MSIEAGKLVRISEDNVKPASRMLARAFQDSSVYVYAFPDPNERIKKMLPAFESVLRYGMRYGKVYTTSDRVEGIAVWMRSEWTKMTIRRMWWAHALWPAMRIGLGASIRMLRLNDYIERKHVELARFANLYLMLLGVDPEYQGNGYGGRLVKGMLVEADEAGLPCYLETTSEENVAFYEHLGFKVIDNFTVPKTTVKIWVMLHDA